MTMILAFLLSTPSVMASANEPIEKFCRQKWTSAAEGLNQRMFEHCLEELKESDAALQAFRQEHDGDSWFKDVVKPDCDEQWTKEGYLQSEMALYCYRQEFEAFNELRYQSGLASYNSGCAEACFQVWRSKTAKVFAKTFECYRKRSEAPKPALPKSLQLMLGSVGKSTQTAAH